VCGIGLALTCRALSRSWAAVRAKPNRSENRDMSAGAGSFMAEQDVSADGSFASGMRICPAGSTRRQGVCRPRRGWGAGRAILPRGCRTFAEPFPRRRSSQPCDRFTRRLSCIHLANRPHARAIANPNLASSPLCSSSSGSHFCAIAPGRSRVAPWPLRSVHRHCRALCAKRPPRPMGLI
jgi:hypothetical protein